MCAFVNIDKNNLTKFSLVNLDMVHDYELGALKIGTVLMKLGYGIRVQWLKDYQKINKCVPMCIR